MKSYRKRRLMITREIYRKPFNVLDSQVNLISGFKREVTNVPEVPIPLKLLYSALLVVAN